MPETRVPSYAAFPEAAVRHVGPGWQQKPDANDRADAGLHLPLVDSRFQPSPDDAAALAAREAAPVATEADVRRALADALADRERAASARLEAEQAHARALAHQRQTRTAVDRYAALGGQIDDFMVDALRDDAATVLPESLRAQIGERGVAEVEHEAAQRVIEVLLRELAQAREMHARADQAVNATLTALIKLAKAPLQQQIRATEQKLAALRQAVELGQHSPIWQPVADALLADPLTASFEVTVADAPLPMPGVPGALLEGPKIVSIMRPDGLIEHISELEFMNRERAAQMAAEAAKELPGTREEQARARSRQQFAG